MVGPGLRGEDEGLRCSNCGSQKADEPWIMPEYVEAAPAITDPALLERAKAGENWTCGSCRHEERALHQSCSVCGAPRDSGQSVTPVALSQAPEPEPGPRLTPERRRLFALIVGGITLTCALYAIGNYLFGTHTTTATISAVLWQRAAWLEERHIKDGSDWSDELRAGAFDATCDRKLRKHVDCNPHKCNAHTVSYSCNCTGGDSYQCGSSRSCTSNNNGSATCTDTPKYCRNPRLCQTCTRTEWDTCYDRCPVFGEFCRYRYPLWEEIARKTASGADLKPWWPELVAIGQDQRVGRSEAYTVKFTDGEHVWKTQPRDETEFTRNVPGSRRRVEYSRAGAFCVVGEE